MIRIKTADSAATFLALGEQISDRSGYWPTNHINVVLALNTSSFKCLGTHISNTQKGCQHIVSSKSPAVSAPYLHCGSWKYSSVQSGTAKKISQKQTVKMAKKILSDPDHMYQRSHSPKVLFEAEISRQRPDDPQLASSCACKESSVCHSHFTDQTVLQKKRKKRNSSHVMMMTHYAMG